MHHRCGNRILGGVAFAGRVGLDRPNWNALIRHSRLLTPSGQVGEKPTVGVGGRHATMAPDLLEGHTSNWSQPIDRGEPGTKLQVPHTPSLEPRGLEGLGPTHESPPLDPRGSHSPARRRAKVKGEQTRHSRVLRGADPNASQVANWVATTGTTGAALTFGTMSSNVLPWVRF